uniref:VP6 n=1 Tax=Changuinola virus TaxID=40052 RepID=A0A2S0NS22_9REOV|nr:VP6 [Changuinola virus]
MSIAVLLVPGDLIAKIKTELVERQIQVDLVNWEKEKEDASENSATSKEPNGGRLADGKKKNDEEEKEIREETGKTGEVDGREKKEVLPHADVQRGARQGAGDGVAGGTDTGTEAESDRWRRLVVLTDDISKRLKQKLGVDVEIFPKEGTILYLEKHVQNELSLDKEQTAQQIEIFKKIQKEKDKGKYKIERIISMKKLIDLVGKKDVNEKPISAKQSGVKLVTNNIKHVNKATAYFTAPTGDTNWKNVAREASKNANIMAYHSEGESAVKDLLHLIDHL